MLRERGDPDWITVSEWLGVDPEQPLTSGPKEKFAKGFEAYVREGKAPSWRLREVFQRLREWLVRIYKTVARLNVKLTDDVRAVFDRLVAKESERVADPAAETGEWMNVDDISEPIDLTVDPSYEKILSEAKRRAAVKMQKIKARRERISRNQLKKEAREHIGEIPVYASMDEIVHLGGLNHEAMRRDWGQETLNALMRKRPGIVSKKGTVFPDEFAHDNGWESDTAMIEAFLDAPTKAQSIERYADDLAGQYEAEEEYYDSDDYLRSIDEELKILGAMTERYRPKPARGLKKLIREEVGLLKVGRLIEVDPALELNARLKELQKATGKAYREGQRDKAVQLTEERKTLALKRREEARARKELRSIREELKKLIKRPGKIDLEYKEQLMGFLDQFDLVGRTRQTEMSLAHFRELLEKAEETGENVDVPKHLLDRIDKKPYTEMTLPELREVRDMARNIIKLGKLKNQLIYNKQIRDFEVIQAENLDRIREKWPPKAIPDTHILEEANKRMGFLERMSEGSRRYFAELMAPEFIFDALDGYEEFGPNYRNIFDLAVKAELQKFELGGQYLEKLTEIFKPFTKGWMGGYEWAGKKHQIEGIPAVLTKEKMILIALHSGNEQNRTAVKRGYQIEDWQIDKIVAELSEEEMDLVVNVWETLDSLFPMLADIHRQLTDTRLPKVEGRYFPLRPDRRLSMRAEEIALKEEAKDLMNIIYPRPGVEKGFTHARRGFAGMQPRLDFGQIFQHVNDVVHYITHATAVRDMQKMIKDPRFRQAVHDGPGEMVYNQLMPWVEHLAKPKREPLTQVERWVERLRRGATTVALGLKVSVAAKQVLSMSQTINELGGGVFATNQMFIELSNFMAKPWKTMEFVQERSIQMTNRRNSWDREIRDIYDRFNPIEFRGNALARDAWFALIGLMDATATYPSWMASYSMGLVEKGFTEAKAIEYADMVVRRTQPAASPKDFAEVQRGRGVKKILTMFYTFFSRFQNQMMRLHGRFRMGSIHIGELMKSYFWIVIFPAVTAELINKRRELTAEEMWKAIVSYRFAGLPYVRDVVGGVITTYDYSFSPIVGAGKEMGRLGKELMKIPDPEKDAEAYKIFKYGLMTLGYWYSLPSRQIMITLEGAMDLAEGQTDDPARLLFPPERR
jgi:hypothetical protein